MNTYLRVSNNETSFSSPALTLIEAPGINLYSSTAGISEIKTKLSPNIDSVVYVIKRNISTPFDTIKIKYSNAKYNPGPNCIPVDVFRILNATTTTHDIKNIVVTKADVNTSGGENIRIVY